MPVPVPRFLLRVLLAALLAPATVALSAPPDSTHPLSPLPTKPAPVVKAASDPTRFTFAVAGDNRAAGHGEPQPPALDRICTEIGYVGPDFTLWTGDTIEGYDDSTADAEGEYNAFLGSAAKTHKPFYNAPSNHEMAGKPAFAALYERKMGALYGSFDYGNSHFVAVNACPLKADGSAVLDGTIDEAQWKWLEDDLAARQSQTNRFVFLHYYPFGPGEDDPKHDTGFATKEERDRFHALMLKYHVRAVFAGHQHRYWHGVRDGIDYFIAGGGGAPIDAPPEEGGFLHFVLVNVDRDKITATTFQSWCLAIRPVPASELKPRGSSLGAAVVSNRNNSPLTANRIVIRVPGADKTAPLAVTATVAYKGKTKVAKARVVDVAPDPQKPGHLQVTVIALLAAHRATRIVVSKL